MRNRGPCFWDRINGGPDDECANMPSIEASDRCFAERKERQVATTCGGLGLSAEGIQHCRVELLFAIDDLCQRGDVWLTGVGP